MGCQATFVEKNPYETRNTNLISLDVATKLYRNTRFPNFVYESGVYETGVAPQYIFLDSIF